jgi:hypothetical protein
MAIQNIGSVEAIIMRNFVKLLQELVCVTVFRKKNSGNDTGIGIDRFIIRLGDSAASSLRHLILAYLVHNCYDDTAQSFASGLKSGSTPAPASLETIIDALSPSFAPPNYRLDTHKVAKESQESVDDKMDVDEPTTVTHAPKASHTVIEALVRSLPLRKRIINSQAHFD